MPETTIIEVTCLQCMKKHTVLVPTAGYRLWATGQRLIQDAMPSLTLDERELLISNTCATCWDKMFGGN